MTVPPITMLASPVARLPSVVNSTVASFLSKAGAGCPVFQTFVGRQTVLIILANAKNRTQARQHSKRFEMQIVAVTV